MPNIKLNGLRCVTCYLSTSCLVAHKAFTERFHFSRSAAAVLTSDHDFHPAYFFSFSTVRLQVVFGLPFLLFPSFAQVIAMLQSLLWSCRSMCPIIFHLRSLTSSLSGFISALSSRSLVLTWSCQCIWSILRRHRLWNTSTVLLSPLFIFHVSHPYNNTGTTSVLYSFSFVHLEIKTKAV